MGCGSSQQAPVANGEDGAPKDPEAEKAVEEGQADGAADGDHDGVEEGSVDETSRVEGGDGKPGAVAKGAVSDQEGEGAGEEGEGASGMVDEGDLEELDMESMGDDLEIVDVPKPKTLEPQVGLCARPCAGSYPVLVHGARACGHSPHDVEWISGVFELASGFVLVCGAVRSLYSRSLSWH